MYFMIVAFNVVNPEEHLKLIVGICDHLIDFQIL